jgi:hypothetical protein
MNELRYRDIVGHPSIVNIHLDSASKKSKHSNLDAWVDVSDKRTYDSIYANSKQLEVEDFLVEYISGRL